MLGFRVGDLPPKGIVCLIGGFILLLSFASDFSYGNINTYMISYMRTTGYEKDGEFILYNPNLSYADFLFVSVSKTLIQGASMPFLGALARQMGTRISIFIGSMIYSSGFLLTGYTSQYYFPWVVVTLSMHGIGFSLVYATAIGAAQNWFPSHMKGFVGSLVLCGYGFGSLIWIPVQTSFVNPENTNATMDPNCDDTKTSCDFYFTDDSVVDQVPSMFYLLGGIFAGMGLVSTILISDVKERAEDNLEMVPANIEQEKKENFANKRESLTPIQVLQTWEFYKIWMGFFSVSLTWGILQNFSKTYGLTIINDDHFYAKIGIVSNVFNGLCRVGWGALYDKLNFRGCYFILGTVVTGIIAILPLLQYLEKESLTAKVLYGLLMSVLYITFPGIYAIIAATINDAFGPDHYQANFGLLFTQSIAYAGSIFIITKIPQVYDFLGYTGMFEVAAAVGVCGVITVAFLPKKLNSNEIKKKSNL